MTCGGPVCSRQVVMGRFYPDTRREPATIRAGSLLPCGLQLAADRARRFGRPLVGGRQAVETTTARNYKPALIDGLCGMWCA